MIFVYAVTVEVKSREVTVKGPKGTLKREFKHLSIDIASVNDGKQIKVDLWFGNRETIASIRWIIILFLLYIIQAHNPFL